MALSERFWEAALDDLKRGYMFDEHSGAYVCLACGERFERGIIYPLDGAFYEAERFAQVHVDRAHGSAFGFLLGLDKKLTGLTDLQKKLLQLFHAGRSDSEVVKELGGGSTSTIRNHRFTLRERMKQAKIFLALMEMAEAGASRHSRPVPIHRTATMVDERYVITEREQEDVLRNFFKEGPDGPLSAIPTREKRKIIILRHLSRMFEAGRRYTEQEVNEMLKERHPDYASLRRFLIEYGFMDRLPDGSRYWLKS
jgi:hypothetical protein